MDFYLRVFVPATWLPHGDGLALLGPVHLLWLLFCGLLIWGLVSLYRRLPAPSQWKGSARRRLLVGVAVVPLVLLASQQVSLIASGTYNATWLPLHACNVSEFLALAFALTLNVWCGELLFTLGVVGAVFALLFPGWAWCPALSWVAICGFLEHALTLALVLMALVGGELRPDVKRWPRVVAIGLAMAGVAWLVDKATGACFFYVNGGTSGNPLAVLVDIFGDPGYLVVYLAGIAAIWRGEYGLLSAARRHESPPVGQ